MSLSFIVFVPPQCPNPSLFFSIFTSFLLSFFLNIKFISYLHIYFSLSFVTFLFLFLLPYLLPFATFRLSPSLPLKWYFARKKRCGWVVTQLPRVINIENNYHDADSPSIYDYYVFTISFRRKSVSYKQTLRCYRYVQILK